MRVQAMPRRLATASSSASSVNGEGSLSAVEISPMGMPSRQTVHVLDRIHRHAAGAEDLDRHLVDVVAAIDRVAGDQRHGRAAVRQDGLQARVVVLRHAEADELALRPGAAAVHGGVDAARHGQLAGEAQRVHVAHRRHGPPACRSASPRRPSGSWGSALPPSPACTSARQRRARLAVVGQRQRHRLGTHRLLSPACVMPASPSPWRPAIPRRARPRRTRFPPARRRGGTRASRPPS